MNCDEKATITLDLDDVSFIVSGIKDLNDVYLQYIIDHLEEDQEGCLVRDELIERNKSIISDLENQAYEGGAK